MHWKPRRVASISGLSRLSGAAPIRTHSFRGHAGVTASHGWRLPVRQLSGPIWLFSFESDTVHLVALLPPNFHDLLPRGRVDPVPSVGRHVRQSGEVPEGRQYPVPVCEPEAWQPLPHPPTPGKLDA